MIMMKKFIPLAFLVPLAILSLLVFLGCGTVTSSSNGSSSSTPKLFITGYSTSDVYVVDPATLTVVKRFSLPAGGKGNWARLHPDGSKIYVSDSAANKVYVINTATAAVDKTIVTGNTNHNRGIDFTADGKRALVAIAPGYVQLLDSQNDSANIGGGGNVYQAIPGGYNGIGLGRNPVNNRMYVVTANYVYSFSAESDAVTLVSTLDCTGDSRQDIAFPPGCDYFFVSGLSGDMVKVFRVTDEAFVRDLDVPLTSNMPYKMTPSPDGNKLYIGNYCVSRVDTLLPGDATSMEVHNTGNRYICHFAVSSDSSRVYGYAYASPTVEVYKYDSNMSLIGSAEMPTRLGFEGSIIYVP